MSIFIPSATSARGNARMPLWISPSTQGLSIGAGSASFAFSSVITNVALTPTSPGCSSVPGGLSCSAPFGSPAGAVTLVFQLYDTVPPFNNANVLADAAVTTNFLIDQNNPVSVVLSPVPNPTLSPASLTFKKGTASSQTVTATYFTDADGNTIPVAPFSGTLSYAMNDPTNSLTVSAGTLNNLTQQITVNYNGGTNIPANLRPQMFGWYTDAVTTQGAYFIADFPITVQ